MGWKKGYNDDVLNSEFRWKSRILKKIRREGKKNPSRRCANLMESCRARRGGAEKTFRKARSSD